MRTEYIYQNSNIFSIIPYNLIKIRKDFSCPHLNIQKRVFWFPHNFCYLFQVNFFIHKKLLFLHQVKIFWVLLVCVKRCKRPPHTRRNFHITLRSCNNRYSTVFYQMASIEEQCFKSIIILQFSLLGTHIIKNYQHVTRFRLIFSRIDGLYPFIYPFNR